MFGFFVKQWYDSVATNSPKRMDTTMTTLPGYVVLGKARGDNSYKAIIERSFSMDLSSDRCLFFWSGPATLNFGGKFEIDGLQDAEHYRDHFSKRHPDMEFVIFDIHSDELPVTIDWDGWASSRQPADTLSGVRDKFGARNPRFHMKEDK